MNKAKFAALTIGIAAVGLLPSAFALLPSAFALLPSAFPLLPSALAAEAPVSAQATAVKPKRLLFLTQAALYKHTSLGPAETAVIELGKTGGYEVTTVEGYKQNPKALDFAFLTPEYLNQFDGVMMMTNGNLPFSDAQKKMLVDFVRGGKGFIGAHCASLTFS